jgi:tetratricopeptide (TPR) repeat protein
MGSYEFTALALSILAVALIAGLLPKLTREVIGAIAFLYAVVVAGYFALFYLYPCPWYKVEKLRAQAKDYTDDGQWPFVEDIGRKLCDCGHQTEGWYLQAESEYQSGQYLTAINFWHRALNADPDAQGDAPVGQRDAAVRIAEAYFEAKDYKMAVDQYQTLSAKSPERMEYRFDYGEALIFNDQYKDAVNILHNVPDTVCCDGIRGEARLYETAALFGESRDADAKKILCNGLEEWPEWKEWLSASDEHFSKIRKLIPNYAVKSCQP